MCFFLIYFRFFKIANWKWQKPWVLCVDQLQWSRYIIIIFQPPLQVKKKLSAPYNDSIYDVILEWAKWLRYPCSSIWNWKLFFTFYFNIHSAKPLDLYFEQKCGRYCRFLNKERRIYAYCISSLWAAVA